MVSHCVELAIPGPSPPSAYGTPSLRHHSPRLWSFLAGPENRLLAAAASQLISGRHDADDMRVPRMWYLFGPPGTGKTHIAHGLCELWQRDFGEDAAEYMPASDFRHRLRTAIDDDRVAAFRSRLRGLRLLAVDDVHALPMEQHVQQELVYTIDELEENDGILILTGTQAPLALGKLLPAVASRLTAGYVLSLSAPGLKARSELAKRMADALGCELGDKTATRVAKEVSGTANEVTGAILEMMLGPHRPTNLSEVDVTEFFLARAADRRPGFSSILRVVAKYYSIPQKVIRGSSRKQSVAFARAMVVYLARKHLGLSFQQIGRVLCGRDHTTIMHSYRKVERLAELDLPTQQALVDLQRLLAVP